MYVAMCVTYEANHSAENTRLHMLIVVVCIYI